MLAVSKTQRKRGIGSALVLKTIEEMISSKCEEVLLEILKFDCYQVVLETELTNLGAIALYESLGFVRDKRLYRYYMNSVDAFRLKLFLPFVPDETEVDEAKKEIADGTSTVST